jgi:hypothetical protein
MSTVTVEKLEKCVCAFGIGQSRAASPVSAAVTKNFVQLCGQSGLQSLTTKAAQVKWQGFGFTSISTTIRDICLAFYLSIMIFPARVASSLFYNRKHIAYS